MCMWVFDIARINGFSKLVILGNFLQSSIWILCKQVLLQLSMDFSETLHTCCGHNEDEHVELDGAISNF